jgi:hypothetical protein
MKKIFLVLAIVAMMVGSLVAQPMKGNRCQGMEGEHHGHHQRHKAVRHDKATGMKMHHMRIGKMVIHHADELDLTDKQIKDIKEVSETLKKFANVKKAELENLHIDERNAMKDSNFKQAKKVSKQISAIREDLALKSIESIEDIHNILNEDQRDELKKILEDKPRRRK